MTPFSYECFSQFVGFISLLKFFAEFARGGDLTKLLHERKFLEERDVRMYVAELVLALTGLHRVSFFIIACGGGGGTEGR